MSNQGADFPSGLGSAASGNNMGGFGLNGDLTGSFGLGPMPQNNPFATDPSGIDPDTGLPYGVEYGGIGLGSVGPYGTTVGGGGGVSQPPGPPGLTTVGGRVNTPTGRPPRLGGTPPFNGGNNMGGFSLGSLLGLGGGGFDPTGGFLSSDNVPSVYTPPPPSNIYSDLLQLLGLGGGAAAAGGGGGGGRSGAGAGTTNPTLKSPIAQNGSWAPLLSQLFGLGTGLLGSQMSQQNNQWLQSALATAFGNLNNATQRGFTGFNNMMNQMDPTAQKALQTATGLTQSIPGIMNQSEKFQQTLPSMYQQSGLDPQMQALLTSMGGTAGQLNTPMGAVSGLLNSQGTTPALDRATTQALDLSGSGGGTSLLNSLAQFGQNTLANGGATPLNTKLANLGINLAGQNPLLSPEQAANIAGNESKQSYIQNQKLAQAQALARGGGPGSETYGGGNNEALADISDTGSQQAQNAFLQALSGQQGLGLTEQSFGGNMAGLGGNLAQAQLGLGTNAVNNAQSQATQRLLGALGLIPGMSNSQSNLLGTSGGIFNTAANTQGSLLNSMLGGNLQAMQQQTSLAGSLANAMNNLYGTQLQGGGLGVNLMNAGQNPLEAILSGFNSSANTGLSGQSGVFSGYKPINNIGNFLSQYAMTGLGMPVGSVATTGKGGSSGLGAAVGATPPFTPSSFASTPTAFNLGLNG